MKSNEAANQCTFPFILSATIPLPADTAIQGLSYQTISSSRRCRRMNRFSRLCSITGNRRSSLPSGRSYELVFPFRKGRSVSSSKVHARIMEKVLKSIFIHNGNVRSDEFHLPKLSSHFSFITACRWKMHFPGMEFVHFKP